MRTAQARDVIDTIMTEMGYESLLYTTAAASGDHDFSKQLSGKYRVTLVGTDQKQSPYKIVQIDGRDWKWPARDTELVRVSGSWKAVLDEIRSHVTRFDFCIQAGGACGVLPAKLSEIFGKVYTFEPCEENYNCLIANLAEHGSGLVVPIYGGLSSNAQGLSITLPKGNNSGTWQTTPGGDIPSYVLDNVIPPSSRVGLVYLDVEGSEMSALMGATRILESCKPLVVLEMKGHGGEDEKVIPGWLGEKFGYEIVGKVNNDVFFAAS
jgi:FkbM family methyltransferase